MYGHKVLSWTPKGTQTLQCPFKHLKGYLGIKQQATKTTPSTTSTTYEAATLAKAPAWRIRMSIVCT